MYCLNHVTIISCARRRGQFQKVSKGLNELSLFETCSVHLHEALWRLSFHLASFFSNTQANRLLDSIQELVLYLSV